MADGCRGEEKGFFFEKFDELAALIEGMPVSYEQDGKGDAAIVSLHYFTGGSDWYILEKDMHGGVRQAFGYAVLNGDDQCAELGYISIQELTRYGADLDLHFTPRTLGQIKAERAGASQPEPRNPNPWVIVTNPGQDDEGIFADFATFAEAVAELPEADEGAQIMKRLEDGTLTTEF